MEFDTGLIKKHPYASGAAVIIGGLLFFYLISGGSSSPVSSSNGSVVVGGEDPQLAQVQAGALVQQQSLQAQTTQAQIAANLAQYQTDAAADTTNTQTAAELAATLAQYQALTTVSGMQTQVALGQQSTDLATAQIAGAVNMDAIDTAGYLTNKQLDYAQQDALNQYSLNQQIFNYGTTTGLANTPNRDNLNSLTAILQTLSTGGNPSVATSGNSTNASTQTSSDAKNAANTKTIVSGLTGILSGLFS